MIYKTSVRRKTYLACNLVHTWSPPIRNMVTRTPRAGEPTDVSRMCEDTGSGCDLVLEVAVIEDPTSGSW